MIKKIHYIWLGGKQKSRVIKKCIASWRKHMPDWEIIEWNENNLNLDINTFCRQAYNAGKFAFSADVLRFDILRREGGLYFDTDVLMLKSLQPLIDKRENFSGYEQTGGIGPGLVLYVTQPEHAIIKEMLELYNNSVFIKDDGTYNLKVVGQYFEEVLCKYGSIDRSRCSLVADFRIYTATYFCPTDGLHSVLDFSENSYTEHLYAASWQSRKQNIDKLIRKYFYILLRPAGINTCKKLLRTLKIGNF